jgi:hypothetical protein
MCVNEIFHNVMIYKTYNNVHEIFHNVMIYKTYNNRDERPELPLEFKNLEEKIWPNQSLRLLSNLCE